MHIYFSGIGGTAIGPLALIAKQAGYDVSGSDKQASQYIEYLQKHGITDIHIGQTREQIAEQHDKNPIDWFVYSSAVAIENPDAPELAFCREQDIKMSKRDELLNQIMQDKHLKLIAVAGTHGKTTTTALLIWLFQQLNVPLSYSVGAKISFGDMGHFDPASEYFVYEADEFDRNFLAFQPFVSIITGVSWDHHEIFPTREDYQEAFREFISQSTWTELWQEDNDYLGLRPDDHHAVMDSSDPAIETITLPGLYNRLDAWLAAKAVRQLTGEPFEKILEYVNNFPGLQRRMEQIAPHLYSDYAHTPEKIRGAMSVALDIASKLAKSTPVKGQTFCERSDLAQNSPRIIVVYEPLTNRRQHYMLDDYADCFAGAAHVYWTPSYLAREDPAQRIIPPEELISHLADPSIAEPAELNEKLKRAIQQHVANGDMVVAMAGGGGGSLDEWLRQEFKN
ncbi:MAG TPA: Mur ligase domain-containing protein [Candidatus Saccharimonadales bacterium]|nr:Mur ligase domain-containing protein [Candidatus Saccharimonadales bacterium]